jgi:MoaD family protein
MSVVVKIPTQLRAAAGGESEAVLDGAGTVQDVLEALFARHEELRARISDGDGSLRRFVNVYLAGEDIRFLDGLQTPVSDGAELTILPAVAGG